MKIYLTESQVCSCSSAQFGLFYKLLAYHLSRSPHLMNCWNFKKYTWPPSWKKQELKLTHLSSFQMSNSTKSTLEENEKSTINEKSKKLHLNFSLKVSQAAKTSVFWRMWISRVQYNDLQLHAWITCPYLWCFSLQWFSCGAFSTTTTRAMPCCTYKMISSSLLLPSFRMSWMVLVGYSLGSCLTDLVSRFLPNILVDLQWASV